MPLGSILDLHRLGLAAELAAHKLHGNGLLDHGGDFLRQGSGAHVLGVQRYIQRNIGILARCRTGGGIEHQLQIGVVAVATHIGDGIEGDGLVVVGVALVRTHRGGAVAGSGQIGFRTALPLDELTAPVVDAGNDLGTGQLDALALVAQRPTDIVILAVQLAVYSDGGLELDIQRIGGIMRPVATAQIRQLGGDLGAVEQGSNAAVLYRHTNNDLVLALQTGIALQAELFIIPFSGNAVLILAGQHLHNRRAHGLEIVLQRKARIVDQTVDVQINAVIDRIVIVGIGHIV